MDTQGRGGAAHAQRRAGAPPRATAQRARGTARTGGRGQPAVERGGAVGAAGDGTRGREQALWRQGHRRRPEPEAHAGRPPGPDWSQRRRQEHAHQDDPGSARTRCRHAAQRDPHRVGILRSAAGGAGPGEDTGRDHIAGVRLDRNRRHAQACDVVSGGFSVSAAPRRSAGAHALRWRAQPAAAGAALRATRQPAGARRTHQRPRHGDTGAA